MSNNVVKFPIDYNVLRAAFAREIQISCFLDQNHVVFEEPETQHTPRPKTLPYIGFKFIGPAGKSGDDSKENVKDIDGKSTTIWNTGGVRKLTVWFNCYANSHEEAYNYMGLWQTRLNDEVVRARLRQSGIAVWLAGNVADFSQLLNTGYEGRAHLESTFGIAMNLQSDLGEINEVNVMGTVQTPAPVELDLNVKKSEE
jgi:hypothetical protein